MRLLTHNYLKSNVRGTENGYPLKIEAYSIKYEKSPFDAEFTEKILHKINYSVFLNTAKELEQILKSISTKDAKTSTNNDDKEDVSPNMEPADMIEDIVSIIQSLPSDENGFKGSSKELENLHKVLLDLHILKGSLICPGTDRKFPITDGIPNMILHEDEV